MYSEPESIEQDINLIHKYNIDSLAVALLVCGIRGSGSAFASSGVTSVGVYTRSTDQVYILKAYIESVWEYANRKNISYPEALRVISKEAQNINNKKQGR